MLTPIFSSSFFTGTAPGEFLTIFPDARFKGMGESGMAVIDDSNNFIVNPGLLGANTRSDVTLSMMNINGFSSELGAQMIHINSKFAFKDEPVGPLASLGTVAATVSYINFGSMPLTVNTPDAVGSFGSYGMLFQVSWGSRLGLHKMLKRVPFGITLKTLYQTIYEYSAFGIGFDVGVDYVVPGALVKGLTFGVSLLNLGFNAAFYEEADILPMTIKVGTAYKFYMNKIIHFFGGPRRILATKGRDTMFTFDVSFPSNAGIQLNSGLEYSYHQMLTFRMGYQVFEDQQGFNAGMGYKLNTNHGNYRFDFAWNPQSILGDNFRLTINFLWKKKKKRTKIKDVILLDLDDEKEEKDPKIKDDNKPNQFE